MLCDLASPTAAPSSAAIKKGPRPAVKNRRRVTLSPASPAAIPEEAGRVGQLGRGSAMMLNYISLAEADGL